VLAAGGVEETGDAVPVDDRTVAGDTPFPHPASSTEVTNAAAGTTPQILTRDAVMAGSVGGSGHATPVRPAP